MILQLIADDVLLITFDFEELRQMNLSFHSIDYKNKKTRKLFWDAIADAKRETGFNPEGARLLVEAFPEKGGGLSLYVTKIGPADRCQQERGDNPDDNMARMKSYIFRFENCNNLFDACNVLRRSDLKLHNSKLYELRGEYFLLFSCLPPLKNDDNKFKSFLLSLSEYGYRETRGYLEAYLSEYGQVICADNAVSKLTAGIR